MYLGEWEGLLDIYCHSCKASRIPRFRKQQIIARYLEFLYIKIRTLFQFTLRKSYDVAFLFIDYFLNLNYLIFYKILLINSLFICRSPPKLALITAILQPQQWDHYLDEREGQGGGKEENSPPANSEQADSLHFLGYLHLFGVSIMV